MQSKFGELQSAMAAEITPKVIDLLVEIAETTIERGDKERAAQILVLALHYPMRLSTLETAEMLLTELEAELCPRVIWDAREQAQIMTLEDMVESVVTEAAE